MTDECKRSFDVLFRKIDSLDAAIRGNGKPGLNQRVSTLENTTRRSTGRWSAVFSIVAPIISGIITAVILRQI